MRGGGALEGGAGRNQALPGRFAGGEGLREHWLGCVWPQEPCSLGRQGHREGRGGAAGAKGQVTEAKAKGKSLQHPVFPGGLPSKY